MKHPVYFKHSPDNPTPLSHRVVRKVRFDELDPLNIVWHGHYASYFEDARVALGNFYGIGYMDFFNQGIAIPLKKFHVDFYKPLQFDVSYTIEALLHWNEAARLDFEFNIYDTDGGLQSSGYSVHLMVDKVQGVLVAKPTFFEDFCEKWRREEIK